MTGDNVPSDDDFADDEVGEYIEDDDLYARDGYLPHDDGGEPIDFDAARRSGTAGVDVRSVREQTRSQVPGASPFESPADAMVRELREATAALEAGHVKEQEVLPRLEKLRASRQPRRLRTLDGTSAAALQRSEDRAAGRHVIKTPWPDYNDQLPGGGFQPGAHLLVSGTGARKTTAVLSIALHAARQGHPVLYVGLEIEDEQAYLRLAAEMAGVRWSDLESGSSTAAQRQAVRDVAPELNRLPIRFEPDSPTGWSVSQLRRSAAEMRADFGDNSQVLIIVDFLQIIAPEPDERDELRERIGKAAYAARYLAKRENMTVLLVSSVAREAYAKVSGFDALRAAGVAAELRGATVVERFLRNRDAIVGLGKESGEIEYSADTVTVAMSLPYEPKQASRYVVFALAKVRSGPEGWCSLVTRGHDFASDPTHGAGVMRALDEHAKKKAARRSKTSNGNGSHAGGTRRHDETDDENDEGPAFGS